MTINDNADAGYETVTLTGSGHLRECVGRVRSDRLNEINLYMKNLSRCSLFAFAIVAGIGIANGAEIPSTSEPAWAMFQHDPSHTSRSSLHAASNPGTRKWEFFTNKGLPETSPAVASDETIYLGADDYLQNIESPALRRQ